MNELKNRNFNGELLTYRQTAEKSNMGINTVMKLAKKSGALVKIGKIARVDWNTYYDYLISEYRVNQ